MEMQAAPNMRTAPYRRRSLKIAPENRSALRALVEHRDGAPVLRPAGNIVTQRHRPFLAVGDGAHALRRDAAGDQVLAHRLGAAGAERDIVFTRAAFVGVTFDREGIAVVVAEPLRLLVERGARLVR